MTLQFNINEPYTLVSISSGLAHTQRNEIIITRFIEKDNCYVFKEKGKRKEFYMPLEKELDKQLVFKGHGLPFLVDSETNKFMGNAKFNFVTDKPDELKAFIEKNCLNPSETKFRKILFTPVDRNGIEDREEQHLFA